jgi:hypothetical protein
MVAFIYPMHKAVPQLTIPAARSEIGRAPPVLRETPVIFRDMTPGFLATEAWASLAGLRRKI